MEAKDHFFKVGRKILTVNINSLSKKALLLYLLYCRSSNQKKNMGCSFIGYNGCKDYLWNKEAFLSAKKELAEKFLIQERPDVKTGILKTTAAEVLNFPDFIIKDNCFRIKLNCDHNHRTYRKDIKQYINIPSEVIDKGFLKALTINDIYSILFLYSETDLKNCWGVNFNSLHAYNSKNDVGFNNYCNFVEGFSKDIYLKDCVEVIKHNTYFIGSNDFNGDLLLGVKTLLNCQLFELIPVIIKSDPEDPDICVVVKEVFKGMVDFKNDKDHKDSYLLLKPDKDEKLIWILRARYLVKTPEYELFQQVTKKIYDFEYNRYHYFDISTSKEEKIKLIKEEDFEGFLADWKSSHYARVEKYFKKLSEDDIDKIIGILPDYIYGVYEDRYKQDL